MRRALVAVTLLAACSMPTGAERPGCGPDWRDATVVVTQPGEANEQPIPIECMHDIGVRRIRVGFTLPPGPDCHHLGRVELTESADAVGIILIGAVSDDPVAGACPDEPTLAVTEVDLAAPIDDRVLLDGSSQE
jgi:hypothetical protein